MYLVPVSGVPVKNQPVLRSRRLALGLAGLGCNCRGGNYISGLGTDGNWGSSWSNPNLVNNPSAGLTPVDTALPPELAPNPVSMPMPVPTMNVPATVAAIPVVAPNVSSFASQPPILPSGAPALPVGYPSTQPNPAPASPRSSWLDQQTIEGVPNKFLLGGVIAILVLAAAAKKGKR